MEFSIHVNLGNFRDVPSTYFYNDSLQFILFVNTGLKFLHIMNKLSWILDENGPQMILLLRLIRGWQSI